MSTLHPVDKVARLANTVVRTAYTLTKPTLLLRPFITPEISASSRLWYLTEQRTAQSTGSITYSWKPHAPTAEVHAINFAYQQTAEQTNTLLKTVIDNLQSNDTSTIQWHICPLADGSVEEQQEEFRLCRQAAEQNGAIITDEQTPKDFPHQCIATFKK